MWELRRRSTLLRRTRLELSIQRRSQEEDDEEQKAMNERFKALYKDIGDDIDYQTLHFVVPMKTRTAREVRSRIQQIYLQLRQQGLPLARIHSDRGLELMAKETRAWMLDRDILATTGESQQPQQNGRAEALARVIMQEPGEDAPTSSILAYVLLAPRRRVHSTETTRSGPRRSN